MLWMEVGSQQGLGALHAPSEAAPKRTGAEARPERSVVGQGTVRPQQECGKLRKGPEEPERTLGGAGRAQNLRGDPLGCVLYPEMHQTL